MILPLRSSPIMRGGNNVPAKRFKGLLCLVAFACLSIVTLDYCIALKETRRLKCLSRSNGAIDDNGDDVRNLSSIAKLVDRILEIEGLELCDTSFPKDALDNVAFEADSEVAEAEPLFLVVPEDPDASNLSTLLTIDGTFLLFDTNGAERTLGDAERNLISTYSPEVYVAEVAIATATTEDKDTIAYVVTTTACTEWYQPGGVNKIAGEVEMGSELYEASAVLKTQVCEMTDLAATNRRLGKTRKLRKLEETGQLSAAEMDYTM